MRFADIFTDNGTGRHYSFEYEGANETNYVIFCSIDICGIPAYADKNESESLYDNPKQAEQIGTVTELCHRTSKKGQVEQDITALGYEG